MPFIDTKLNIRLSEEKETALKTKLGEAISTFPGKSEYWLMLNFTDNCRMWFRGYDRFPVAMVLGRARTRSPENPSPALGLVAGVAQTLPHLRLILLVEQVFLYFAWTSWSPSSFSTTSTPASTSWNLASAMSSLPIGGWLVVHRRGS
jgi:hypothetical protein